MFKNKLILSLQLASVMATSALLFACQAGSSSSASSGGTFSISAPSSISIAAGATSVTATLANVPTSSGATNTNVTFGLSTSSVAQFNNGNSCTINIQAGLTGGQCSVKITGSSVGNGTITANASNYPQQSQTFQVTN